MFYACRVSGLFVQLCVSIITRDGIKISRGWVFIFFKRLFYVERTSVFSCEQSDITHCFHIPRWGDVNISGDNVGEFPCQIKSDGNKLIFSTRLLFVCYPSRRLNYLNFHFCWSGHDRRLVIKSQLLSIAPE